ncbi:MAG: tetratricopeptide repeat protein [Chloroflexi bacterium]|nr:tetratricopeptide repeat protein [Chloroflexota bacterium]
MPSVRRETVLCVIHCGAFNPVFTFLFEGRLMSVPRRAATFGALLREHRLAARLTQETLAERSGISPRTIQEVEAGDVHPRRSTALSLVQALGLSDETRHALMDAVVSRPRQRSLVRGQVAERQSEPDFLPLPEPPAEPVVREPALVALSRPTPTNIPWPVSSLLGREADLAAIRTTIVKQHQRLVTLTGVGGSGKTSLAVQVAADLLDAFVDGVWFVELASTADAALVAPSVAGVLGVYEIQGTSLLDTLLGFLRRKRLLLVLDNCEHLIEGCAELARRLLTACPDLSILATSREPLRVAGEQRRPVRPLDVPDPGGSATLAVLGEIASVRLFVERAHAIDPDFALTEANATWVTQICARLDGIPLAIELAASRIAVLSAEQIAARLDGSFRLLTNGSRGGPTRQQTIEAALDWSYDLLSDAEQAAFRTLSSFAGGFDLDAAERVCGEHALEGTADPATDAMLDVLTNLVDKSLVVSERTRHGHRYRLLEPVRQYAALALAVAREREGARARHAAYYVAFAERAAPLLRDREQSTWLARLELERDNVRAALTWLAESGDVEHGLRLAVALTPCWEARAYLSEGRHWLETAIAASRGGGASPDLQMQALIGAGGLAQWQGDIERAETLLVEALASARNLKDPCSEAETLGWLSAVYRRKGAIERGIWLAQESLRLGRELANDRVIAFALLNLGVALQNQGETDRALPVLDECLRRYRHLGDDRYVAITSTMLGRLILTTGQIDTAANMLRESLLALRAVGDHGFLIHALGGFARVAEARGEPRRAVTWFAAAEALREALGIGHPPVTQASDLTFLADLQAQLTVSELGEAYAAGEAMSLEQVLAEIVEAR